VTDQLAFDLEPAPREEPRVTPISVSIHTPDDVTHDGLLAAVRALVAEPGMTDAEVKAVVEDALAELGWQLPPDAARAKACRCVHRLVLPFDRGDGPRCLWCGRQP